MKIECKPPGCQYEGCKKEAWSWTQNQWCPEHAALLVAALLKAKGLLKGAYRR